MKTIVNRMVGKSGAEAAAIEFDPFALMSGPCSPLLNQFPQVSRFFALVCLRSREPPGGPRRAFGGAPGALDTPGPGSNNIKTRICCRALLSGRGFVISKTTVSGHLNFKFLGLDQEMAAK